MNWSSKWPDPETQQWIDDGKLIAANKPISIDIVSDWPLAKGFKVKPEWVKDAANYPIVHTSDLIIPILDQGIVRINAALIGDLAVHTNITDYDEWQITHVPTLVKFNAMTDTEGWSKDKLIKWCQKVQEQLPEDWTVLRGLTNETYKSNNWTIQTAKDRIFEMCKNVKV